MKVNPQEILSLQDPRLIKSQLIFDGAILQLYHNQLKLDQGMVVEREIIHHQPAVAILAEDQDRVILVKQYRAVIQSYIWEIPAGILDKGDQETAQLGAARELEEETGYQATRWQVLCEFFVSPGFLDERIILFKAQDLIKVDQPLPPDVDEAIECRWFKRQEIKDMLGNGQIIDAKTIIALQAWLGVNDQKG